MPFASLLLLLAAPTHAAATACLGALPAELATWEARTPLTAGTRAGEGATLSTGHAATVSLHAARHLGFAALPEAKGANGGTLTLPIEAAGTYRIALGDAAWVDLVEDGKPVASGAHGHGPECSGVRKMVDFTLARGTYTVQLSGSPATTLAVMVAKVG